MAGAFVLAGFFDEGSAFEGGNDAVAVDAADGLDLSAGDRLFEGCCLLYTSDAADE